MRGDSGALRPARGQHTLLGSRPGCNLVRHEHGGESNSTLAKRPQVPYAPEENVETPRYYFMSRPFGDSDPAEWTTLAHWLFLEEPLKVALLAQSRPPGAVGSVALTPSGPGTHRLSLDLWDPTLQLGGLLGPLSFGVSVTFTAPRPYDRVPRLASELCTLHRAALEGLRKERPACLLLLTPDAWFLQHAVPVFRELARHAEARDPEGCFLPQPSLQQHLRVWHALLRASLECLPWLYSDPELRLFFRKLETLAGRVAREPVVNRDLLENLALRTAALVREAYLEVDPPRDILASRVEQAIARLLASAERFLLAPDTRFPGLVALELLACATHLVLGLFGLPDRFAGIHQDPEEWDPFRVSGLPDRGASPGVLLDRLGLAALAEVTSADSSTS